MAISWFQEADDCLGQCRLATPRFSNQPQPLPSLYSQADAVNCFDRSNRPSENTTYYREVLLQSSDIN
jgi:hypothetical protein